MNAIDLINIAKELYYPFMFFIAILAAWGVIAYFKATNTKAKTSAVEDTNKTLNELIEAQDKKINAQNDEIQTLKTKVDNLEKQLEHSKVLEELVSASLDNYFITHPDAPLQLSRKLKK